MASNALKTTAASNIDRTIYKCVHRVVVYQRHSQPGWTTDITAIWADDFFLFHSHQATLFYENLCTLKVEKQLNANLSIVVSRTSVEEPLGHSSLRVAIITALLLREQPRSPPPFTPTRLPLASSRGQERGHKMFQKCLHMEGSTGANASPPLPPPPPPPGQSHKTLRLTSRRTE